MKSCKLVNIVNTDDSDNNNNCNKNNKQQSTTTTSNDDAQQRRIATFYDDMAKLQISKSKGSCSTKATCDRNKFQTYCSLKNWNISNMMHYQKMSSILIFLFTGFCPSPISPNNRFQVKTIVWRLYKYEEETKNSQCWCFHIQYCTYTFQTKISHIVRNIGNFGNNNPRISSTLPILLT